MMERVWVQYLCRSLSLWSSVEYRVGECVEGSRAVPWWRGGCSAAPSPTGEGIISKSWGRVAREPKQNGERVWVRCSSWYLDI